MLDTGAKAFNILNFNKLDINDQQLKKNTGQSGNILRNLKPHRRISKLWKVSLVIFIVDANTHATPGKMYVQKLNPLCADA